MKKLEKTKKLHQDKGIRLFKNKVKIYFNTTREEISEDKWVYLFINSIEKKPNITQQEIIRMKENIDIEFMKRLKDIKTLKTLRNLFCAYINFFDTYKEFCS